MNTNDDTVNTVLDKDLLVERIKDLLVKRIREHIFTFVAGLTTDNTIDDDQRVGFLLTEISTLLESYDAEGYAYYLFEFLSNALAIRGNNSSCPNIELDRTILLIRNTMERYPYPLRSGIISIGRLATALYTRFKKSNNTNDIDESISITRHICDLNPFNGLSFLNLGGLLAERFQFGLRNEDDLLEAVEVLRRAYEFTPESLPQALRWRCLLNFCVSLKLAYKVFGQPSYLEEAIDIGRRCITMDPMKDPVQLDSTSTFDSLVTLNEKPEQNFGAPIINLSELLHSRFKHYGTRVDLEEAIQITLDALESTPPSGNIGFRRASLQRLALYIRSRKECDNNVDDANAVVEIHREILQLQMSEPNSDQSGSLSNLGGSLNEKYKITGDKRCLDEAICIFREGEMITLKSHSSRSYILHGLADALHERYRATGAELDLEESIVLLREALDLRPTEHDLRFATLQSLSTCLRLKYANSMDSVFMRATTSFWRSWEDFSSGHASRSPNVNSLGATFREIFQASREKEDIDESIKCLEEALTLTLSPSDQASTLYALGSSLCCRSTAHFVESQYIMRDTITMKMKAVKTPGKILSAVNNQVEYLNQFDYVSSFGDLEDIKVAISCYEQVIGLGYFDMLWSYSMMGFAYCLSTRFHYLGDTAELQKAIGIYRSLLNDHISHFSFRILANFAQLLLKTFIATKENIYLEEAVTQFRAATNLRSTSLLERQTMARSWASAIDVYHHEAGLEAYKLAIRLLPQIVAMNMNIDSRRKALQEADAERTCHNGVGCAIHLGRLTDAVEFLEQGRAIYWTQVLQLRSPLEELFEKAPELATILGTISDRLHLGSLRDSLPNDIFDSRQRQSVERDIAYYQHLENEWEKVLEEVRGIKGFEDFLLPKKISTLQASLESDETIVLLSQTGRLDTSSALIISHDEIRHVSLPGIDQALISLILSMIKLGTRLQEYRGHLPSDFSEGDIFPPVITPSEKTEKFMNKYRYGRVKPLEDDLLEEASLHMALHWIWDEVTKPIFLALGIEKSNDPPRVWWCPTGLFSFLPLHAAGVHNASFYLPDQPSECVSDYVVSSYIPALGTFLSRRSDNSPGVDLLSEAEFKMMVILEPRTLPWTVEELRRIKIHVSPEHLTVLGDTPSNPASVESVISRLTTASIVHFSCHGKQNIADPLKSALLMDDGPLTVTHIMQQPMPHSYLAFLCACETAAGTEELADEAMSFGSSLLYSGFQSIVGTMWSIADEDGATISDYFYEYLFDKQGSQGSRIFLSGKNQSARALHLAVKRLRGKGIPLKRWVPFIHMGM